MNHSNEISIAVFDIARCIKNQNERVCSVYESGEWSIWYTLLVNWNAAHLLSVRRPSVTTFSLLHNLTHPLPPWPVQWHMRRYTPSSARIDRQLLQQRQNVRLEHAWIHDRRPSAVIDTWMSVSSYRNSITPSKGVKWEWGIGKIRNFQPINRRISEIVQDSSSRNFNLEQSQSLPFR